MTKQEQELLDEIHQLRADVVRPPGYVNGSFGKFLALMRQIQGAAIIALIVVGVPAAFTWGTGIDSKLHDIEVMVKTESFIIPGTVPLALYNSEMKGLHMRLKMVKDLVIQAQAESKERDDKQQRELEKVWAELRRQRD
jgi:hypothetical protein